MKNKHINKYIIVALVLCLSATVIRWGMAYRSDSQRPTGPTTGAPCFSNSSPTSDAATTREQQERKERRENYTRIIDAGIWPEVYVNPLDFFPFLLDRDPALAIKFYNLAPGDQERSEALHAIACHWFRRDPSACIRWLTTDSTVRTVDRTGVRSAIREAILGMDYNRHDVAEVLDTLSRWADSETDRSYKTVIEDLKYSAIIAFGSRAEISVIGDRLTRMGLGDKITYALKGKAQREPDEVMRYYEQRGGTMPDLVAEGLVCGRLDNHPDKALEYLAAHPWKAPVSANEPGFGLGYLAEQVMNRYLEVDSMAASDRLSKMESGRTKDYCIKAMAAWLAQSGSKAEILPWLPAIEDARVREAVEKLAK